MARAARVQTEAVRPWGRVFRGSFLSWVRRTGDGLRARPARPDRRADGMAVPALRHPVPRKLLSALRPPDGGVGLPAAGNTLRRTNGPLGAMDNRPGRLHHLRDHGLLGPGGRPRIRRPGNPGDWLGEHGE